MGPSARLNEDFRQTCSIIFGREIGGLEEFAPYLSEMMMSDLSIKSSLSQKKVMLSSPFYREDATIVSQEELGRLSFAPLNINDIKDIDSLFEAAQERAVYCGNKLFGKNMNVSESDNVVDSVHVHHSHDIYSSKYVAYCAIGRYAESIYGVSPFWRGNRAIRCSACYLNGASRSFECYYSNGISDSYYTFNCSGCTDCIFCFNLRSKSHMVGNLALSRERYSKLKEKLVSEMAETLQKDKRIFSIAEICGTGQDYEGDSKSPSSAIPGEVEAAFGTTTKILFGKEHRDAGRFAPWLMRNTLKRKRFMDADGRFANKADLPVIRDIPAGRFARLEKALASASDGIKLSENEQPSLGEIAKRAGRVALFAPEIYEGQSRNCCDTSVVSDSTHVSGLWWARGSSYAAYSTIVTESKYVFGGYARVLNSEFCINSHNVTRVRNCLECDSCYLCRDCYFCHNCENVEEGIFCFNAKGLRYAVLNKELPKEEYLRVKKMLLGWINSELERKGGLDVDIFSLGKQKADNARTKREPLI
ncbi:TPA: hypothetical protein HA243_04545 [Candidatus Micrarchaeota archaeon]|nr:hypothetical protein [Candidatus Micrarchaeota archaeon]